MSGAARQFATSYTNYGGERYSVSFNDDESAHNFELDMWVYLQSPSTGVQILELDLNQVLSNGQTILYGISMQWLVEYVGFFDQPRVGIESEAALGKYVGALQPA